MSTDERVLPPCRSVPAPEAFAPVPEALAAPWDPSNAAPTLREEGASQCLERASV